jgi:hypothetical protein
MILGFSGIISGRSDFNDGAIHVQVVQGEGNWGFGQILANIFLLLPIMIAIESFTGGSRKSSFTVNLLLKVHALQKPLQK